MVVGRQDFYNDTIAAVDLPNYKTYLDLKSRAGAPEASWHLDHPNVLTPDGNVAILVPKCLWPAWSRTG